MKPKTRLDAVVKLRERDEDRARLDLAEAHRLVLAADRTAREAADVARQDDRARGCAADWQLAEHAHARALVEARQAERACHAASEKLGSSRQRYVGAHARAEALRRVVEARRFEVVREAEATERKHLDEVAMLQFVRR